MFIFLDIIKQEHIRVIIRNILLNLVITEFNILSHYMNLLVEYITFKFNISESNYNLFWEKLINDKDIISLLFILLPYIDDKEDYKLFKSIEKLEDISIKKKDKNCHDRSINNYEICNFQFSLYVDEEVKYDIKHLRTNFYLLINTIDQVSNKLYVNWENIFPLRIDNYWESSLYKNSVYYVIETKSIPREDDEYGNIRDPIDINVHYLYSNGEKILEDKYIFMHDDIDTNPNIKERDAKNIFFNEENLFKFRGVSFGDIYNTLYYHLYSDIKDINWLIFQSTFENSYHDEIFIKKFNDHISIDEIYYNIKWSGLSEYEQENFHNRWLSALHLINIEKYFLFLKEILLCFEKTYSNINIILKEHKYVKIKYEDVLKEISDDTKKLIIENLNKIPINNVYEFFQECIQKFINTWYGKKIVKFLKDGIEFNYNSYFNYIYVKEEEWHEFNPPEELTIKYLYIFEYAKAMVTEIDDNKRVSRNDYYNNLYSAIFIENLNKNYYDLKPEYIDIENFIRKDGYYIKSFKSIYNQTYGKEIVENFTYNIKDIGVKIIEQIKLNLINITFESHIYKGLYSELIFDKTDIDYEIYEKHAYYYLTNRPYEDMSYIQENNNKISKIASYINLIKENKYSWNKFYSFNFIFQINFYHKYINNRVLLVTGAPGQGKSTQIPKLFLYSLKMIDNKQNGNVLCTAPRINATKNNAERIAWELGFPIVEISHNYNTQVHTFNPYVQYNSKEKEHVVFPHYGLILNIMTDKLLLKKLLNNPILKSCGKTSYDTNLSEESFEFSKYYNKNIYDIIIIDEAHEHNTNVDLILSIIRDTILLNNSLKLVIMSATMDDDEPLYRSYYKYINDNFTYPFNLKNSYYDFNRLYVDKRIHLSPPQQTTKYNVKEYYLEDEPKNYIEAEKLGLERLYKLLNTTQKGDILFFSTTKNNILNICRKVNESNINDDIICLPYYSTLRDEWLDFSNISYKIKKLKIHRSSIIDHILNPKTTIISVSDNTYKRVIIVSTNIAEASITVDSLKYIIDTGYVNNVKYNFDRVINEVSVDKISITSSIQRKGRVGRVSDGVIYYIYTRNSRNKKTEYQICNNYICDDIYDLLYITYNETYFCYMQEFFTIDKFDELEKRVLEEDYMKKLNFLNSLIKDQYVINNDILPSILNFSKSELIYSNIYETNKLITDYLMTLDVDRYSVNRDNLKNLYLTIPCSRYYSGYSPVTVYDYLGEFYLIHPNEKNLNRDILTRKIIKKDDGLDKILAYFKNLIYNNMLIDHNLTLYNIKEIFDILTKKKSYENLKIEKTVSGRILKTYFDTIIFDDNNIKNNTWFINTLIYAFICKRDNIVMIMICLIVISKYEVKNINENIYSAKHLISDNISVDLSIYYNLAKEILVILEKYERNIYKILIQDNKKEFLEEKKIIDKNIREKKNVWDIGISLKTYEIYLKLYNKNKLSTENIKDKNLEKFKKIKYESNNMFNSLSIKFNIELIKPFLDLWSPLNINFKNLINENNIKNTSNVLKWFEKNLPCKNSKDEWFSIKKSFIYGFNMNCTCIYNLLNNKFINLLYSTILEQKKPFNKNLLFVYITNDEKIINIIIDTKIETLIELNLYYYNSHIIKYFHDKEQEYDIIKYKKEAKEAKEEKECYYKDIKKKNIKKKDIKKKEMIVGKKDPLMAKFVNQVYNYLKNRSTHINHIFVKKNNKGDKKSLLDLSDNYNAHLLKLWSLPEIQVGGNYLDTDIHYLMYKNNKNLYEII